MDFHPSEPDRPVRLQCRTTTGLWPQAEVQSLPSAPARNARCRHRSRRPALPQTLIPDRRLRSSESPSRSKARSLAGEPRRLHYDVVKKPFADAGAPLPAADQRDQVRLLVPVEIRHNPAVSGVGGQVRQGEENQRYRQSGAESLAVPGHA